jgi:hypothetical protein
LLPCDFFTDRVAYASGRQYGAARLVRARPLNSENRLNIAILVKFRFFCAT